MAKAIEFVLRSRAGAIRKGVISGNDGNASIDLTAGGDVSLNLSQGDVLGYVREGRDLHITLADGRVVTVRGYFGATGPANRLFLSTDGDITQVSLTDGPGDTVVPVYGRAET
ncbi:MAG: BapA/Bap/LapF family prefix-like domain-containing protein [Gemmobacter sp.]|uniref:BapA/Bap/LapF family prefix-like domain-containing protein n=1 Tax=Gemmobacter sp. TaxID=1898957 RepID=UPI00391B860F